MPPRTNHNPEEILVKHTVADRLRKEIASGALRPGTRIVEGTWARRFGVAQGSIREAINILAQDGFVTKTAGRSARVVSLSEQDVLHIFQLRGVLEGLAARLVAQGPADASPLDDALNQMRQALKDGNPENMLDGDLKFHLELCRLAGNPYLLEHARKVILPLFAFARITVLTTGQTAAVWQKDIEAHQRIIDIVREGPGELAEQYVHRAMARFGRNAYDSWEKKDPSPNPRRSRRRQAEELPAG